MDESLSLDFLRGLQTTGIRPGLTRISRLLARLGHPERRFPSVLIAGTNGKGSTAAFLDAILRAAGCRTGLFTSPHLVDVRERFRINGSMITETAFCSFGEQVRAAMSPTSRQVELKATYFEALTAIGFLAFADASLDLAVVEIGMGGRLDSTNVLSPCVSVLTNVTVDHARYLGSTVESIATEKVGIARAARPFVTGVDDQVFDAVVGPHLLNLGTSALRAGRDFHMATSGSGFRFQGQRWCIEDITLSLAGSFQKDNAALAVATASTLAEQGLPIGESAVRIGLASAVWPGRWQTVSRAPLVLLDGGHNPGAATRVAETLRESPLPHPCVLVHSSKAEKDYGAFLQAVVPFFDHVIETTIAGLADPENLFEHATRIAAACPAPGPAVQMREDLTSAVAEALRLAGHSGSILIAGSLYLVGAALSGRPWEATRAVKAY